MPSTSRPVWESSAPVGSSARMTDGLPGQGPGNGHPLLLAAGELAGLVFAACPPSPTRSRAAHGPLLALRRAGTPA